ncbi:MAG: hypothetical protein KDK44_01040 [Chlamydiia bacterium]|nr:hypothetical protein [Chlamydiia bacterium]MCP5509938.1 hypothetical protein [Chlamydiales bacterium]
MIKIMGSSVNALLPIAEGSMIQKIVRIVRHHPWACILVVGAFALSLSMGLGLFTYRNKWEVVVWTMLICCGKKNAPENSKT